MFLPTNITLQNGDSGDFVTELQRRLSKVDCFNEEGINGFFDGATYNGVMAFQMRHGIRPDGVAGPETLRRLNGVLSGDTSTTSDKKEEEQQAPSYAPSILTQEIIAQQDVQPVYTQPLEHATNTPQTSAHAAPEYTPAPAPVAAQPSPPSAAEMAAIQQQQMLRENIIQQPPAPQPTGPSVADMLAAALAKPAPAPQPTQSPPLQASPQPIPQTPPPVAPTPEPAQTAQAPATPAPEQPRGLVGRAMQYANEMVQKLAAHFEAKLPPSVLAEVQKIGEVMARSGMKEAPIPLEPTQARGPELPSRGQEPTRQRT